MPFLTNIYHECHHTMRANPGEHDVMLGLTSSVSLASVPRLCYSSLR